MPSPAPELPRRRRLLNIGGLIGLVGLSGLGIWLWQQRSVVPLPGSAAHEETWTAWTTGLLALQVGDEKRAQAQMTRVTELLPNDAAGHANLGLFFLRRGTPEDLAAASESLARAEELAPDNARVQTLLALLESRRGNSAGTIKYLRRALEISPSSLKARYALAEELERADAANLPEVQALLKQLSEARPQNRLAALELARIAAKRGDRATLRAAVARLAQGADSLSPEAREQLRLAQAAVASNAPDTATQLVFLSNVLSPDEAFARDRLELKSSPEQVGDPLESLITLATPPGASGAPDDKISFRLQPGAQSKWDVARAIYLNGADAEAKSPPPKPALVALSASELRLAGANSAPIAAFSGAKNSLDSLAVADWNNDYRPDVAIANSRGVRFFQASTAGAAGKFEDVTAQTSLSKAVLNAPYSGIQPFDVEADGDLDLVLMPSAGAPIVLRNNADGTFLVARPFEGIEGARASVIGDLDSDADCDIAFLDARGALRVFSNERSGLFRLISPQVPPSAALGISDSDRDGVFELLVWGRDGSLRRVRVQPSSQPTGKPPVDELAKISVPSSAARIFAGDFDLNGGVDILASSGSTSQVILSSQTGAFAPLALAIPLFVTDVADLNGDGRLDLAGRNAAGAGATMLGAGVQPYLFQFVRPRAKEGGGDQRLNSFGVGGSVELRARTLFQKQVVTGPMVHFGIGPAQVTNAARLLWPNGVAQAEFDLGPNQSVLAEQRLSGSCPFLWAWNGREIAFVKDCNWDSPLGLKINAQDTAGVVATQDWVKVRGDQLQPRDGILDLRLTADLWESHFFDEVAVLAVDHPENEEAWIDERFAIPIPPLRVEASGILRSVRSARDDRGRDVSATVQKRDAKYLDVGRGRYQGVTRSHWVELDLSDAPSDKPLWLIAEGWLHPTDSSINVALAQGKHAPPQSLSIQVPDGRGGWRTARSNLGFPSGKHKAITLDLDGVFVPGAPRRLRLASNLEIYWDRLSWAQKKPASRFKIQRLQPQSAQLRYRGFSRIEASGPSSPELPLSYATAGVGQRWSDLIGFHTRWGDVRELVQKVDDRYVIMNAGDEIALKFRAPAPPARGWKRDYVFISDGWTKDGNLNTGLSKTLLPLPSHDRPLYSSKLTRLQDDPIYKRHPGDWRRFHTRYVAPTLFNSALLPPQKADVVTSARAGEGGSGTPVPPARSEGEGSRVPVEASR